MDIARYIDFKIQKGADCSMHIPQTCRIRENQCYVAGEEHTEKPVQHLALQREAQLKTQDTPLRFFTLRPAFSKHKWKWKICRKHGQWSFSEEEYMLSKYFGQERKPSLEGLVKFPSSSSEKHPLEKLHFVGTLLMSVHCSPLCHMICVHFFTSLKY